MDYLTSILYRVSLQFLSIFDLVRYCVSVCNQIASHLHIFVFKIKPPNLRPVAASQSGKDVW